MSRKLYCQCHGWPLSGMRTGGYPDCEEKEVSNIQVWECDYCQSLHRTKSAYAKCVNKCKQEALKVEKWKEWQTIKSRPTNEATSVKEFLSLMLSLQYNHPEFSKQSEITDFAVISASEYTLGKITARVKFWFKGKSSKGSAFYDLHRIPSFDGVSFWNASWIDSQSVVYEGQFVMTHLDQLCEEEKAQKKQLIEFRNTLQNETAKSVLNDPELQKLRADIAKLKAKLEDEAEERYYLPAREKWESERLKCQFTLTNPPSEIQFNFP